MAKIAAITFVFLMLIFGDVVLSYRVGRLEYQQETMQRRIDTLSSQVWYLERLTLFHEGPLDWQETRDSIPRADPNYRRRLIEWDATELTRKEWDRIYGRFADRENVR